NTVAQHQESFDTNPQELQHEGPLLDSETEYYHEDESDSEIGETVNEQDDRLNSVELSNLLANIAHAQHPVCQWKTKNDTGISCLFQTYQKECIRALHDGELRKADIADLMMRAVFKERVLSELVTLTALPGPDVDDAAVLKAVRLRLNGKREEASESLRNIDRRIRLMFDNLYTGVPPNRPISEVTFTVNYVAPVFNSILKISGKTEVHYPNTESHVQKKQGLKPDRPDILVKARGHEILYREITGPCRANCLSKTNWDLFRLAGFGKTFLDMGNGTEPLLQVVHDSGFMMRLSLKLRGTYILEKIGLFNVPCTIATVPALLATLPVLLEAKRNVEMLAEGDLDVDRKCSWRFDDIIDAKKRTK
ncbi:hypothetical protein BGX26_003225, partial [Mortierella sp. AD094]